MKRMSPLRIRSSVLPLFAIAILFILRCGFDRLPAATAAEPSLPNIIIIYADDLGYGDLSCYDTDCAYKTPRLDRMAAEGIRFTDAHSPSTICSPSRYGLYSGQQMYRSTGGVVARSKAPVDLAI